MKRNKKMNRRTAIGGILGLAGIGLASTISFKYFIGNSSTKRGELNAHLNLLAELVDIIIPPTETPGAKEALVHNYVISYMENCSSTKEYNNFLNGLNDLQETSLDKNGRHFEDCSTEQKIKILQHLDDSGKSSGLLLKINNKLKGRSFFNILKTLTIEGYCTSFIGATKHLEYSAIPARYIAITKLTGNQKAWATR
jgi:Gluconate 2-dehydrogenase subunit 3